jgi:hypothetical protein
MKHRILLLLLLLFAFVGIATAAPAPKNGEKLDYTLFFNWKFVWIKAGKATLTTRPTTYEGQQAYKTTLLACSSKSADVIFRLRDTLTTIVKPNLEPLYFVKHCEEGKDIVYERAWFSRTPDGRHRARQTKIYADGRVRESDVTDSRTIYDMVSLLVKARTFDTSLFTPGQRLTYPMVTGRRVEEQVLIYMGKESIETLSGDQADCLVFSLVKPKTVDGVTTQSELLRFYISDDPDHTPIQLDLFLKFGVAKAKLNNK